MSKASYLNVTVLADSLPDLLFGNPAASILIRARSFASHPFGVVCLYRSSYSIVNIRLSQLLLIVKFKIVNFQP